LISEIRIRIYNIPLATYPIALRDAAKLLDQKKTDEAKAVVQLALNTLAIVDRVEPLPIVTAQAAIEEAQTQRDKDKEAAKKQLAVAKQELDRAKELGYAGNDPEYPALASAISDIEKQLNGGEGFDVRVHATEGPGRVVLQANDLQRKAVGSRQPLRGDSRAADRTNSPGSSAGPASALLHVRPSPRWLHR
jgi:hypothetical protein